jgi:6-phospho-3-hexuloisomerase
MEQHNIQELMQLMAEKIEAILKTISHKKGEKFIDELLNAKQVFVIGSGRSGLIAKAFAMRLWQLGLPAHVVGETTTPALNEGDVLVVFSNSGGSTMVSALLSKVHQDLKGTIWLITSMVGSKVEKNANFNCIVIEYLRNEKDFESFAPLGTVFESVSMVFADAVISRIMEKTGTGDKDLQHTNLE